MMRRRNGLQPPLLSLLLGLVASAALGVGVPGEMTAAAHAAAREAASEAPGGDSLLTRVRENLQRERQQLLEFVYREKRRPLRVSKLGKVTLGDELTYEIYPSGDPDRPRRVLVAVNGRPPTPSELAEQEKRLRNRQAGDAAEEAAARRKAQERFDDAFRVFRFEMAGTELMAGTPARIVAVIPRPDAETKSDIGKWMKKFRGRAWVSEGDAQLVRLELTATDSIALGWGVVGRIAEGTKLTYVRRDIGAGVWLPAHARFEAHGRTLLFRSFSVDSSTEWFDYRPHARTAATRARPDMSTVR